MYNLEKLNKLPQSFYLQKTETVAKKLLGKILVRKLDDKYFFAKIVETEAYLQNDEASHSFKGKSNRNRSMFNLGGIFYVYQIYGIHFCCNVVTNKENIGEAVLIRALEPITEISLMGEKRFGKTNLTEKESVSLTNGPAKLCEALSITKADDGTSLLGNEIFILNRRAVNNNDIVQTERIGITKGKQLPLRFYIRGNKYISRV